MTFSTPGTRTAHTAANEDPALGTIQYSIGTGIVALGTIQYNIGTGIVKGADVSTGAFSGTVQYMFRTCMVPK